MDGTDARASSEPTPLGPAIGPLGLIAGALGLGLATGWAEAAWHAVWPFLGVPVTVEAMRVNRHAAWMSPLSDASIFAAAGLVLAPLALRRGGRRVALSTLMMMSAWALMEWVPRLHWAARLALAAGFAYRAALWATRHEPRVRRGIRLGVPLLVVASAVAGPVAYWRADGSEARALAALRVVDPKAPNLLLIVLDTVRADHLSAYGYDRDTTPNLARLAARGVRFDHARSTAPWTLPSHASMFTGLWPHETGADEDHAMIRSCPTLAEALSARGYASAGFVANTYYCNAAYGLDRGFARYEDCDPNRRVTIGEVVHASILGRRGADLSARIGLSEPIPGVGEKPASRITDDALAWVDGVKGRPFFAFLNYFDAHAPYLLPEGIAHRRFGLVPSTPEETKLLRGWHAGDKRKITPRQATLVRDGYDDCLAYLDAQVGRLIDELGRRGLLDSTFVVITSDHGEELGEHGLYGHGRSLYSQELRVPLLVAGPGVPAGRTVSEPVSLRDVAATSVDLLGLETDAPFPGRSLAGWWTAYPPPPSPILSEVAHKAKSRKAKNRPPAWLGPMSSVLVDGLNYIRRADGQEEVYDTQTDPADTRDLAASRLAPSALESLRVTLRKVLAGEPAEGRASGVAAHPAPSGDLRR